MSGFILPEMLYHPQTRQLRRAQIIEEVVAQLGGLDGAQVLWACADPFGKRLLRDPVRLELGEKLFQCDAGQIGLQIGQATHRLA